MKLMIDDLEKFIQALAANYYLPDNVEAYPNPEAAWARILKDTMAASEEM
jgi:hypothetical protein